MLNSYNLLSLIIFYFLNLNFALADPASSASNEKSITALELVGTITGKHTLAVIRSKDGSETIYQLNQKIMGYTITAITQKSIRLTQDRKSSILELTAIKNRQYYGADSKTTNNTILATYKYRINRNTFNSLHEDTQSWLDNVQMEMHIVDGYFTGYIIVRVQENSPAELLGLTEGDIIKGIDGILIKYNTENFIKKISTLDNATTFTLNMSHEQQDFNLQFIIQD